MEQKILLTFIVVTLFHGGGKVDAVYGIEGETFAAGCLKRRIVTIITDYNIRKIDYDDFEGFNPLFYLKDHLQILIKSA